MKNFMQKFGFLAVLILIVVIALQPFTVIAQPTTITDTTTTTATNDGTVNTGEYAGCSVGLNSGFGGFLGPNSQLCVDSSETGALNIGLIKGGSNLENAVIIYIDSIDGGFGSTANFTDTGDGLRKAISGLDGQNRSTLTFATGFTADFAIAFESSFGGLWAVKENDSHAFVKSVNLTPLNNSTANNYEIDLTLADLGLSAGGSFKYVATFISTTAYRSNEFQGVAGPISGPESNGNFGWNAATLAQGDFNTFNSVAGASTPTPDPTATPESTSTPTSTPESTATPEATSTPIPGNELVVNGGMETATNNQPDNWTGAGINRDKVKCNTDTKTFAHTGECAYQFRGGAGENASLTQFADLAPLTLESGQSLTLSVWYKATNTAANGRAQVRVKYSDAESTKINLNFVTAADYTNLTNSANLTSGNVTNIRTRIRHSSTAGKVLVDDVSVILGN